MALSSLAVCGLLLIGIIVGTISGMLGIGGAVIIIPILMFACGFAQQRANGTSMAMLLPPIGIFGVLAYHRTGNIDWPVAMLMACGFTLGAYFGGMLVNTGKIPDNLLRELFAIMLLYIAGRMLFQSNQAVLAALETCGLIAAFAATYIARVAFLAEDGRKRPCRADEYRERAKVLAHHDYEI